MANPDLLNAFVRKQIIDDIKSNENIQRKRDSLKSYEIYNDNAYPYVRESLLCQMSLQTVNKMPIVSDLNVAKAVVNKQANIYVDSPVRTYENIQESDAEVLEEVYSECGFNSILSKANKYYKLRNQAFLQVVSKEQKLKLRVLHGHNIDVIPDENDPEQAYAYIVSSFDKSAWLKAGQDGVNQQIAEADDYKSSLERYQVWTADYVFTMDGRGNLVAEILENPLKQLPFVDISKDKDFEFFVRIGQALTDFTVYYNCLWSDLFYILRMQGFSLAVISGDANLKPDNLSMGPGDAMFLPTNPNNPESKLSIDFKNPDPNVEANLKAIEAALATFLTTSGLDSKAISSNNSGSNSYSSALERLLAMLDQFRASKEDFDLFKVVEYKLHKIVTKYLSVLSGTPYLDNKYKVTQSIENSELNIQFVPPEMVETKAEQLANAQAKIDLGISDKAMALAEISDISVDEAVIRIQEIEQRRIDNLTKLAAQGADASKSALNGAQVTSLVEIVSKVAAGLLPIEAAKNMIVRAFNTTEEEAANILGDAGKGFTIDPGQLKTSGSPSGF